MTQRLRSGLMQLEVLEMAACGKQEELGLPGSSRPYLRDYSAVLSPSL